MSFNQKIQQVVAENALPSSFVATVENFYLPLVKKLMQRFANDTATSATTPTIIGIQGSQGSGKSTCADFFKLILAELYNKSCLVISIDDMYLTRAERQVLAAQIHPLLITRGVPGTHDISLLEKSLSELAAAAPDNPVHVPVFDKTIDDRADETRWQVVTEPVDFVILEGWCVGIPPQQESDLVEPINDLEAQEDADGSWREFVNSNLAGEYQQLYAKLDFLISLQAPSFESVFGWRLLQEQKLAEKLASMGQVDTANLRIQSEQELVRFIAHYERLTRHALATMPTLADWILMLNEDHSFAELIENHSTVSGSSE